MKKATRIILPVVLVLAIIICSVWYLFIYDREFTRDILLSGARYFESNGKHDTAKWFYNMAYKQAGNNDEVAIELASQYKENGNYTKAEYTLYKAIQDGGGIKLYIELCKTYVEQDKLLDAVNLLNNVTGEVKRELESIRPKIPTASPGEGSFNQLISVAISSNVDTIYVNPNGQYPSTQVNLYQQPIQLAEGEHILYAIAVDKNGVVSPLAVYKFEIGEIIKPVIFADPAIELAVKKLLPDDTEAELFTDDLWQITSFVMPADAKDYSDLQYLTKLESLTIDNGIGDQLTNLSGLSNLKTLEIRNTSISSEVYDTIGKFTKLETLTLNNCGLATTTPLASLTSLKYLDLGGNTIRDITAIENMTGLQELYMDKNALSDLTGLNKCGNLEKLDVSENALTTLSSIYDMKSLSWLDASGNKVSSVSGIESLTGLQHLYLSSNTLTDVSSLGNCQKILDLSVDSNQITDLSPLASLNTLMYLNFAYNQVSAIPQWNKDCSLVTIDGSHNLITSLDPLSGLETLNNVYMDYNTELSSVEPLATCHRLIRVNVYGTKVTEVTSLTSQSIIVNYDPTK